MNWENYNGQLKVGDIVEMSSKVPSNNRFFPNLLVTFVKHFGIIVEQDGELKVLHNPYDGSPLIETQEKVFYKREPDRVLHTEVTNEQILEKFEGCKNKKYKFWEFNCEDFVSEICGCNIGKDQRIYYFGAIGVVIFLAVVLTITYILVKKTNKK